MFKKDEEIDRTESDTLNGFPSMKLSLLPGGCAFYELPIKPGQINSMIQPAKKQGEIYWVSQNRIVFLASMTNFQPVNDFLRTTVTKLQLQLKFLHLTTQRRLLFNASTQMIILILVLQKLVMVISLLS